MNTRTDKHNLAESVEEVVKICTTSISLSWSVIRDCKIFIKEEDEEEVDHLWVAKEINYKLAYIQARVRKANELMQEAMQYLQGEIQDVCDRQG